ncbi:MAG: dipeptide epimerase, partial [Acidobacteria bacterium]|nr:dipeptide epimerase [Acidobacteriota bacterium]
MNISRKSFVKALGGMTALSAFGWAPASLAEAAQAAGAGAARSTRITSVELFSFSIPRKTPGRNALGTLASNDAVLVRLRTADGVTGLGEASPFPAVMSETQASELAVGKDLATIVKGRDAFAIPQIVEAMDAFVSHSPGIKAAFETALWDICGKIAKQPVHRLLGTYRESFETDLTVHLETPQEMGRLAKSIADQGFRNIKVKLGEAPALDIDRMRAIREAVGPAVNLRIDANQGWSPANAVIALRGLEKYDLQFCEQPVPFWDWEGMTFIRGKVAVPIMADEAIHSPHDVIAGIRRDAMDMINIKLMKSGGILPALRIATIADAANIQCMVGCMSETRIALTAAAHLVFSQRNIRYADLDSFLLAVMDPVVGGMQVSKGVVQLPDTPGLGV